MRRSLLFAILALTACGQGWGPVQVAASSPGTVILVGGGRQAIQTFLDVAQSECGRHGFRQAVRQRARSFEENFFIQVEMIFECR